MGIIGVVNVPLGGPGLEIDAGRYPPGATLEARVSSTSVIGTITAPDGTPVTVCVSIVEAPTLVPMAPDVCVDGETEASQEQVDAGLGYSDLSLDLPSTLIGPASLLAGENGYAVRPRLLDDTPCAPRPDLLPSCFYKLDGVGLWSRVRW
jgi:hypothetical protein